MDDCIFAPCYAGRHVRLSWFSIVLLITLHVVLPTVYRIPPIPLKTPQNQNPDIRSKTVKF